VSLVFRDARPEDIEPIADLWDAGWHQGHAATAPAALTRLRTRASFAERAEAHRDGCFVTERDGALAGFTMLEADEIYQFYVAAAAQGSDVARAQMTEAERRLTRSGIATAWLACGLGNARAARFYEKCGWRNVGIRRQDLETSEGPFALDVIRFEKPLR
jgi:GNAT superfamily N-acetyltransferase